MTVYARYKRDPEGLRKLVELLETTPLVRRQKMIDVGMAEDAAYTDAALKLVMTFEDVQQLPDGELAEVISAAHPRLAAFAIIKSAPEIKERFLRNAVGKQLGEIRDFLDTPTVSLSEIGSAQLKLVEVTRGLEKRGLVKTKQIPRVAGR